MEIKDLDIFKITPPELDVRRTTGDAGIAELAESIASVGLIEPIVVRPNADGYEIIAGHRRYQACKALNLDKVECKILDVDENKAMDIRAQENLHRLDISPIEEADIVGYLHYEQKVELPEIAKRVGKKIDWVHDRIDIIHYPEFVKDALHAKELKLGVAKELVRVKDKKVRALLFDNAIRGGITVGTARQWRISYMDVVVPEGSSEEAALEAGQIIEPMSQEIACFMCGEDSPVGHTHAPNLCGRCFGCILQERADKGVQPG